MKVLRELIIPLVNYLYDMLFSSLCLEGRKKYMKTMFCPQFGGFVVLKIEPRTPQMLVKCCNTELYPLPCLVHLIAVGGNLLDRKFKMLGKIKLMCLLKFILLIKYFNLIVFRCQVIMHASNSSLLCVKS